MIATLDGNGGYGYEIDVNGKSIADTAQALLMQSTMLYRLDWVVLNWN